MTSTIDKKYLEPLLGNNFIEPLLDTKNNRSCILPIQYKDIWVMYKKHESCMWHASEVKLDHDSDDWDNMSDDERNFLKHM